MANIPEEKKYTPGAPQSGQEDARPARSSWQEAQPAASSPLHSWEEGPPAAGSGPSIPADLSADEAELLEQTLAEIRLRRARAAQAQPAAPLGGNAVSMVPEEDAPAQDEALAEALPDGAAVPAEGPAAAATRGQRFAGRLLYILGGFIPHRGDSPAEIVRKCIFIVALITLIGSLSYIINDMLIQPMIGEMNYNTVRSWYEP